MVEEANDPDAVFERERSTYMDILQPLFLPDDPIKDDIVTHFAALLRVLGMEDGGWDPYSESRHILDDLNLFMKPDKLQEGFKSPEETQWRIGLVMYCHIVEMDAPYEVLTNLLRRHLGKGYSPNPFYDFLTKDEKKHFQKYGLRTTKKIAIIEKLSQDAGLKVGDIFKDFYRTDLRNAVQHSDYILAPDAFRSRNSLSGDKGFKITYEELDTVLLKAKAFISAFFGMERIARFHWGRHAGKALPYDPIYKGLMEVLVDDEKLMCGFRVLWPNNSSSTYRRTPEKVEMINCMVDLKSASISLMVGMYARFKGDFSPLVEIDGVPLYPPLDGTEIRPTWPATIEPNPA